MFKVFHSLYFTTNNIRAAVVVVTTPCVELVVVPLSLRCGVDGTVVNVVGLVVTDAFVLATVPAVVVLVGDGVGVVVGGWTVVVGKYPEHC